MEIIDAASRVNINAATKEMLMHLPGWMTPSPTRS